MLGLTELRAANDRAAAQELKDMEADTIAYLRHAYTTGGTGRLGMLLLKAFPHDASSIAAGVHADFDADSKWEDDWEIVA